MRRRLPNRRMGIIGRLQWPAHARHRLHLTVGIDNDGTLLELFLRGGGPTGSETDYLLDDIAIAVSVALQHGATLAELQDAISRYPQGQATSLIAAVVDEALQIVADLPAAEAAE